jgi:hypothetical protein
MTPHARRLRDRVNKGLWTGRLYDYDYRDVMPGDAICWCRQNRRRFWERPY